MASGVVSIFFGSCSVGSEDNARHLREVPSGRAIFFRVIGREVVFFVAKNTGKRWTIFVS
jgi:hypothetical protein